MVKIRYHKVPDECGCHFDFSFDNPIQALTFADVADMFDRRCTFLESICGPDAMENADDLLALIREAGTRYLARHAHDITFLTRKDPELMNDWMVLQRALLSGAFA